MGCGVLVVSPDPFAQARTLPQGTRSAPRSVDAESAGRDLAEALRGAGHSVVECETPADDAIARGVVEQAWVVLAGLDLMVIVEDPFDQDHRTGPMCERVRELMRDRGRGGAIVWVPPGVPISTATARLLDLAESGEPLHGPAALPLEVEPIRPRDEEEAAGPDLRHRHLRVVRDADAAGAGASSSTGPGGLRGPGGSGGPGGSRGPDGPRGGST